MLYYTRAKRRRRGISTVGSALHSHCRGQRFKSAMLHQTARILCFALGSGIFYVVRALLPVCHILCHLLRREGQRIQQAQIPQEGTGQVFVADFPRAQQGVMGVLGAKANLRRPGWAASHQRHEDGLTRLIRPAPKAPQPSVSAQMLRAQLWAYRPSSSLGSADNPPDPRTARNVARASS